METKNRQDILREQQAILERIQNVQRDTMRVIADCRDVNLPATAGRLDDAIANFVEAQNFTREAIQILKQRMIDDGQNFED